MDCDDCGYMLLIDVESAKVFCQNCKTTEGGFKQIEPKYRRYTPE